VNPAERVLRKIDETQRRFTPTAFAFGVVKKFGDDNGGVLTSNMAYSVFVSLFPLLLVLTTILGLVASVDASFRTDTLNAVAGQVPLLGRTLTENVHQLKRASVIGLIVGLAGLIWGATGLAQSGLFTMEQVWNLPGPVRPGYVPRLGRALVFLGLLGAGVIVTTGLTSLDTYVFKGFGLDFLAVGVAAAFNVGMYIGAFRVLTPTGVPTRNLITGAVTGGLLYTVLQTLGVFLLHHYLHSDSAYGVFATVLGLLAYIYLAVEITLYSAEINVVLARRLWPRALVQPPLTEADRASMALQALQNQRRPEQHIEVTFHDREADAPIRAPKTPDEIALPVRSRRARVRAQRSTAGRSAGGGGYADSDPSSGGLTQ
jgi:YihY family inner membrane protein